MINVLHSIGWGIVAFIITGTVSQLRVNGKQVLSFQDNAWPPFALLVSLSVFLLTL